ncbi:hypothetical protein FNV43_RR26402 [Rhamnella rubrinervis]|uniref:Cytochrome P450 n=1 Tax=Rhamnella rubrinervis TaxID=2594499 RepID=A0A8K0DPS6_9ROSA|nr:hypothetical protein FNV43_RR26402 [Rhamnella rubrinervis]
MADKHGPIFSLRLGQKRTLVVSSWEIVKECFTTNDRIFANRPSIAVGKYVGYNNAIFSLAPYGQYWRDIRKLATRALSAHRLELLKHVRASEVDLFIKELFTLSKSSSAKHNVAVPLSELLEHLTFNINLRLIAGKRFSASMYEEKNSEVSRLNNAIKETLYLSGVFVWSDAIPWLEWLDIHGHVRSMKRTFKEIDFVLSKWLEEHRERKRSENCSANGVERDLMDVMLSTLTEEDVMSAGHTRDTVIKATALTLIIAGTDTTYLALNWALSLLLNHVKVLKTVQEELDTHVGKERWVDEGDMKNLVYLQAVIKEALRLYPSGPLAVPHEAIEDCKVAGYYVPKGTRLLINIWKLHRDPRVWTDPEEFKPERFLSTHADLDVRGQNFAYIPFSSGRRKCPGISSAMQVLPLTLGRLIQGFNITTPLNQPVDMTEGLAMTIDKANPVHVLLSPRLPHALYQP